MLHSHRVGMFCIACEYSAGYGLCNNREEILGMGGASTGVWCVDFCVGDVVVHMSRSGHERCGLGHKLFKRTRRQ